MFGSFGGLKTSVTFVSRGSPEHPAVAAWAWPNPRCIPGPASSKKKDMVLNGATPDISVDPETYVVKADDVHLVCEPASEFCP